MSFLFQCVNSNATIPSDFLGNQVVAKADDKQIMCIDTERNALLDFKAMILRDRYDRISTWGTKKEDADDDDCCKWMGVTCNNQTGHVTELDLHSCVLEGEIGLSLLNLTHLTLLDLSENHFNGSIPDSIGSLTELTRLDLSRNSLNGTIPVSIGSLTELTHLDLSENSFSGSLPMSIGSLTELTHLDLSDNSFSGNILMTIGSLTELTDLDLSENSFTGTIPASIGSLTELRELRLSGNSFIGTIPASIGSLTELRSLSLSNNSFNETIRLEFGNLVHLKQLSLYDFERCSVCNISWLSLLSHLEELDMTNTSLAKADHWVNTILSLQNLTRLTLDGCDLSQVMHPYSSSSSHVNSSSSSNIAYLYLRNNNLNSSMYPWLYPLTRSNRLEYLYLDGNKLDEFPKYLGNLCHLKVLYFNNNSALVPFSDFLKNLSAGCTSDTLQSLQASSSQFTGSISDDIQHFSSLEVLKLDDNQLSGTISEKMWELPNLQVIDVSSNSLRGAIFVKTANLYIDLSKNKFYGGISFLSQNVDWSLTLLDLSHNSFFGQIPDCLWHLKELKILNLAHNNLSGRLPASVEYLIQLEVLYLYNNNFSGELPLSLRNCSTLTFLDLGANRFSGNVPVWIGENLSGLYVLNLGSNDFFGPIPLQICQLENLQILDLSMNDLNESIPSCVNNLTSMVQEGFLSAQVQRAYSFTLNDSLGAEGSYVDHAIVQWQGIRREFSSNIGLLRSIDLSSNNLTGKIPSELTDLQGLMALNLSANAFFGEIPHKIGQMKVVQILDLSRNNLSGGLPSTMSGLSFLNYLDVSCNKLRGRIPHSTQLQSFEPSRYIGNPGLCGPPLLTKSCPGDEELEGPSTVGESEGGGEGDIDELERWFYIGGAVGFSIGFWIVCSTLLINLRGRHTFFHFLDSLESWVYVKVVVVVVVFKAKFQRPAQE